MKYGEKAIMEAKLEAWPNKNRKRDYVIEITLPEFTCLCPRSGYPDFAVIKIKYIPDKKIVELKSLKLYINKFRSIYISHEDITNKILDEFVKLLQPKWTEVTGDFNPRGNVRAVITVFHKKSGYKLKSEG
jgi:7-cyano-7-deazaguanine reductase